MKLARTKLKEIDKLTDKLAGARTELRIASQDLEDILEDADIAVREISEGLRLVESGIDTASQLI